MMTCDSPTQVFLKHKSIISVTNDCFVFKFLQCSVAKKHTKHIQSENPIFKLLWYKVDRPLGSSLKFKPKIKHRSVFFR